MIIDISPPGIHGLAYKWHDTAYTTTQTRVCVVVYAASCYIAPRDNDTPPPLLPPSFTRTLYLYLFPSLLTFLYHPFAFILYSHPFPVFLFSPLFLSTALTPLFLKIIYQDLHENKVTSI